MSLENPGKNTTAGRAPSRAAYASSIPSPRSMVPDRPASSVVLTCDGIVVAFPGRGNIAGIMVVLQVLPALIAGGRHIRLPLLTRDPVNILINARKLARIIQDNGVQLLHARSRAPAWSAWL